MAHRNWAIKLISFCITVPITVLVVLFAVSNRDPVPLQLWLIPGAIEVPLYLVFLVAFAAGFLIGGVIAWGGELGHKRRANRAVKHAEDLERDLALMRIREEEIRAQVAAPAEHTAIPDRRTG